MDILDKIDAAVGCQQCHGPLGLSPSDDFCSEDCQNTWRAERVGAAPEPAYGLFQRLSAPLLLDSPPARPSGGYYFGRAQRPFTEPGHQDFMRRVIETHFAAGAGTPIQVMTSHGWVNVGAVVDGHLIDTRPVEPTRWKRQPSQLERFNTAMEARRARNTGPAPGRLDRR